MYLTRGGGPIDASSTPNFGKPFAATATPEALLLLQHRHCTHLAARGQRSRPPQEIVDLFHDLQKLPQLSQRATELRGVCLGFCYDPLSAMGYIYANRRCSNAGHRTVCR